MKVTFDNLSVTVDAENPKAAYDMLCSALEALPAHHYTTDTFTTNGQDGDFDQSRDTGDLQ